MGKLLTRIVWGVLFIWFGIRWVGIGSFWGYPSRNVYGFRALIRVSWNAMRLLSELSSFWKLPFRDSRRSFISEKDLHFELLEVISWIFACETPGVLLYRLYIDWLKTLCVLGSFLWLKKSVDLKLWVPKMPLTERGFAVLWAVRLTFSTKSTPFLLVISKAHEFFATFWLFG